MNLSPFTKLYKLSKTLCLALIPQRETLKFIQEEGLIKKDELRAEDYKKAKILIDEYHKDYINKSLSEINLTENLQSCYDAFSLKNKLAIRLQNEILRTEIVKNFDEIPTKNPKQLVETDVPHFLMKQGRIEDAELFLKFKGFTTYFRYFHKNRESLYTDKNKSSTIAHRVVHDNLPKFFSNINIFKQITEKYVVDFSEVEKNMNCELKGKSLSDIFTLEYFNQCVLQNGIDVYNTIIGGKTDGKKKLQGINETINLFRQKNKLKNKEVPTLSPLYKQVLSDRNSFSYLPEAFNNVNELITAIKNFDTFLKEKMLVQRIENLLSTQLSSGELDLSRIYIKKHFLGNISIYFSGNYSLINDALSFYFIETNRDIKGLNNKLNDFLKQDVFSIQNIEESLKLYSKCNDFPDNVNLTANPILDYFKSYFDISEKNNLIETFEQSKKSIQNVFGKNYENAHSLTKDREGIEIIINYLDNLKKFSVCLKTFSISKEETIVEKDFSFYNEHDDLILQLRESLDKLYDKCRNFLTKKPYSSEKIKLNFDNPLLGAGHDVNKESDYCSLFFRKDGLYYFAIMPKEHNKSFINTSELYNNEGDFYEKMRYRQIPEANRNLPKTIFSEKWDNLFQPTKEIVKIKNGDTTKVGKKFILEDVHTLVDFYKDCLFKHDDWQNEFNFQFQPTNSYNNINNFFSEVNNQAYKIKFENISSDYIHQLVAEGKLFLFQIYNKDFSSKSTGKKNIHTIFFEELFSEENINDSIYRLNGGVQVFFRKKSISKKDRIIHPAGLPIDNKNPNNPKHSSQFPFDIIKDRRYTEDKFLIHIPITINAKSRDEINVNHKVIEAIKKSSDIKFLSLDRGERYLLYLSFIDGEGKIIKQMPLNEILVDNNGTLQKVDYYGKIVQKEIERKEAKKNWSEVGKIKDIKKGYLDNAVYIISRLAIEYGALIILEDLNSGFKNSRSKIDRQVYQLFEKSLINKLQYLFFKEKNLNEIGGHRNSYQLSAPFETFEKIEREKQSGIILYVPPKYTSKIDYATGFVNLLYVNYKNEKQSKEFFNKFDAIRYNKQYDYFEFETNFTKFKNGLTGKLKRNNWTICTCGEERFYYHITKKEYIKVNVTAELKKLFQNYNINYESDENIQSEIFKIKNASFFKDLTFYLKLVLQMRYSDGKKRDFILSPVANSEGLFFNTENATENEPKDADANGSYHIGLKGKLMAEKIKKGDEKLFIGDVEWFNYAQEQAVIRSGSVALVS